MVEVLRLVLRFVEKCPISRGFGGIRLDSKSGAGQPVVGSNPMPSARFEGRRRNRLTAFMLRFQHFRFLR